MRQLVLLYWGCVFLMYLSQVYYPAEDQLDDPPTGKRHFMLRRADMFMIIIIAWMTCFSFLRTSYNDIPDRQLQELVQGLSFLLRPY